MIVDNAKARIAKT